MKTLSEKEYVKIGLWLDDPYGDNIRLQRIREPSAERLAALEFVRSGQTDVEDLYKVYVDKGREFYSLKSNRPLIARQHVL